MCSRLKEVAPKSVRQKSDTNIDRSVLYDSPNKLSESEFVCWCIDRTNMDIGDEDENDERSMLEGKHLFSATRRLQ